MTRSTAVLAFASSLLLAACSSPPEAPPAEAPASEAPVELTLPAGFTATVFADGLGKGARHIAVDAEGDVYVRMENTDQGGGIWALRDSDGDGRADQKQAFGDSGGSGLALHGGFLYASSSVDVFRYPLAPGALAPEGAPEMIVSGFEEQRDHKVKTLTFDEAGHLYVNVGAPSNACMEQARTPGSAGQDPCPQLEWHGGVWRFDAEKPGQTLKDDGHRYATGTRNLVALEWNAATGSLYAVQHGRDQLDTLWVGKFDKDQNAELPAEEFLKISEGDDFGWPYCYYDPAQQKKVLGPEYGGDGQTQGRCAEKKGPILAFPAHLAPNDLLFYTGDQFPESYRGGAFVAFHGSWNRAPLPQKGYFVAFVPFADGAPQGDWSIFADGFSGLAEVPEPSDAKHRPCGLALGPDGSLYVSDSVGGTVWRIRYTG